MRAGSPGRGFDCVQMKRRIQEKIHEETRGMDAGQLAAYFHQRVAQGPFADLWKAEPHAKPPRSS